MRSSRKLIVIVALALLFGVGALIASNPLRRSDDSVRASLLEITPIGSSYADVRALLIQRGWQDDRYLKQDPLPAAQPFLGGDLGGYQGWPWYVTVCAFWEFDDKGRLKGVRIERYVDAI